MKTLLALTLMVLISACGRSTTIYHDGDTSLVGTDGRSDLPSGFANQSVNSATVGVSSSLLTFNTAGGASSAGAFNDAAIVGSRALLGISKYDSSLLSAYSLSFDADTASALNISLLVDLDCTGSTLRTLESSPLPSSSSAGLDDTIWAVSGMAISSGGTVLVPSMASGSHASLRALVAAYPSACLRGGVSDAQDMPSNLPISSLVIGTPASTSSSIVQLTRVSINGDVFNTWGTR